MKNFINELEQVCKDAKRYEKLIKLVEEMRRYQKEEKERKRLVKQGLLSDWKYDRIVNYLAATEYAVDCFLEENL